MHDINTPHNVLKKGLLKNIIPVRKQIPLQSFIPQIAKNDQHHVLPLKSTYSYVEWIQNEMSFGLDLRRFFVDYDIFGCSSNVEFYF